MKHSSLNSLSLSLFPSLSAKRTSLPRPPSPPPRGKRTLTLTSAADIRAHPPHFSPCTWEIYSGASDRTGYVLQFQNMDPILIFRPCRWFSTSALTLWALLRSYLRVLYFGEVSTGVSSLLIPIWMFIADYFLIPRPNDWARVQPETWLPTREDLRLKFEGCWGALGCPSPTVHWICNYP